MCVVRYDREVDSSEEHECSKAEDYRGKLIDISGFFQGILKMSYGKEKFDTAEYERCLEEIAAYLELKTYEGTLAIGEKNV